MSEMANRHPSLDQDRREDLIGTWTLTGTTVIEGVECSSYGQLTAEWDLDGAWLLLRFEKQNRLPNQPLLKYIQCWSYLANCQLHTRLLLSSKGSHGTITTPGWQGNSLRWAGPFFIQGQECVLQEILTRESATAYRFNGHLDTLTGTTIEAFDLLCTKQS